VVHSSTKESNLVRILNGVGLREEEIQENDLKSPTAGGQVPLLERRENLLSAAKSGGGILVERAIQK